MRLLAVLNLELIRPNLLLFLGVFALAVPLVVLLSRRLERQAAALDAWLAEKNRLRWIIGAIAGSAIAYYFAFDVLTYGTFKSYLYDFGYFHQVAWKIANGGNQAITLNIPSAIPHFLGDHFQPILYLVGALYAMVPSPYTLFFIEVVALISGVIPLAKLAKRLDVSPLLTVALTLAYCWAPSTFFALAFSFHQFALLPPLLLWMFTLAQAGTWRWYAAVTLLALCVKEDVGYFVACFGLWQALCTKDKKVGIITAVIGIAWSLAASRYGIPFFRGSIGRWFSLNPELSGTNILHPGAWLSVITGNATKWDLLITSFGSFGFLPLLNPLFLPVYPMFAERLLSNNPNHWNIIYQYGAPLAAVFAAMSMRGANAINQRFSGLRAAWPALVVLGLVGSYLGYRMSLADLPAMARELGNERTARLRGAEAAVPKDASVCTQDFIGTHLANRNQIWFLSNVYDTPRKCDYVVADETLQFYPIMSIGEFRELQARIQSDPEFTLVYSQGTTFAWKR